MTVLDPRLHRSGVAACLVEAGSLADPADQRRLADPYSTDLIGAAVARGVQRYAGTFGLESDEVDAEDTLYETPVTAHAADDASPEPEFGIQDAGQSYTDYARAYSDDTAGDSAEHADDDAYGDPTPGALSPFPNILRKRPDLLPAALAADAALKKLEWFKDVYLPLAAATANARLALDDADQIVVIPEEKSVTGLLGSKVVKDVLKRAGKSLVSELVGRDFARVLGVVDFLLKLKTALELEPARRLVSEQNHSQRDEAYRYKLRYFIRLRNAIVSPGDDPTAIDYRIDQAFWGVPEGARRVLEVRGCREESGNRRRSLSATGSGDEPGVGSHLASCVRGWTAAAAPTCLPKWAPLAVVLLRHATGRSGSSNTKREGTFVAGAYGHPSEMGAPRRSRSMSNARKRYAFGPTMAPSSTPTSPTNRTGGTSSIGNAAAVRTSNSIAADIETRRPSL